MGGRHGHAQPTHSAECAGACVRVLTEDFFRRGGCKADVAPALTTVMFATFTNATR